MNLTVLGAGAWGTALAASVAERHPTRLWARDAAQAAQFVVEAREDQEPGHTPPSGNTVNSTL